MKPWYIMVVHLSWLDYPFFDTYHNVRHNLVHIYGVCYEPITKIAQKL